MIRDRGSATVWALALASVTCCVFAVVLAVGQAVAIRHRAGSAADLAALAAAERALDGQARACAWAARVATEQRARLRSCVVDGDVADVTAEAESSGLLGLLPAAAVRSRAGPAR